MSFRARVEGDPADIETVNRRIKRGEIIHGLAQVARIVENNGEPYVTINARKLISVLDRPENQVHREANGVPANTTGIANPPVHGDGASGEGTER